MYKRFLISLVITFSLANILKADEVILLGFENILFSSATDLVVIKVKNDTEFDITGLKAVLTLLDQYEDEIETIEIKTIEGEIASGNEAYIVYLEIPLIGSESRICNEEQINSMRENGYIHDIDYDFFKYYKFNLEKVIYK